MVHTFIYHAGYLLLFACFSLVTAIAYLFAKRFYKISLILLPISVLLIFGVYARFVEPNRIMVSHSAETSIGINKRVALIADMHLGVYNDSSIFKRTVDKINQENIDAVLIAGDFTYHPTNIRADYEPLKDIKVPVYAILGNHDLQHPGPDVRQELESVLRDAGVTIINNESVEFGDGLLVGLGDNFAGEDDVDYLDKVATESTGPIVVLTHNPDTVLRYSKELYANENWVTLTGHTHCGQARIPFLYKSAIRNVVQGEWYDGGLYDLKNSDSKGANKLFITCGIGEVGLPIRFNNPPTIDIIEL